MGGAAWLRALTDVHDANDRARRLSQAEGHVARYEAVVEDKAVASRCGRVSTPGYGQVAGLIYRRARGRRQRYRAQMAGILPVLAPWAKAMDYRT